MSHSDGSLIARRQSSNEVTTMGQRIVCNNEYDKSFQITRDGRTAVFDSFECAISAMAPLCPHCQCRIIGHGVEENGTIYCCAHCAKLSGRGGVRDRA
jgi:Rieske 2Fe-2S protein